MADKEESILYIDTYAGDDPEKASMPFVLAGGALAMDIKATIVLQGNGVYLAKKGYIETMLRGGGFPHMKKLMDDFLALGGTLRVCAPCIKERNIDESDLIEGSKTTAGGEVNVMAIAADAVLVF